MDYSKMMFAVEVQKLAASMQATAERKEREKLGTNFNAPKWEAQHTVMSFVPDAMQLLQNIAATIPPDM
jgi:hypothetical protein